MVVSRNWPSGACRHGRRRTGSRLPVPQDGIQRRLYLSPGLQATLGSNNGQFSPGPGRRRRHVGAGGQRDDAYGAIYQTQSAASGTTVTARIDQEEQGMPGPRRASIRTTSLRLRSASATRSWSDPRQRSVVPVDSDNDGYLDQNTTTASGAGCSSVRLCDRGPERSPGTTPPTARPSPVGRGRRRSDCRCTTQARSSRRPTTRAWPAQPYSVTSHHAPPRVTLFANIDASVVAHHGNQFTISGAGADVWGPAASGMTSTPRPTRASSFAGQRWHGDRAGRQSGQHQYLGQGRDHVAQQHSRRRRRDRLLRTSRSPPATG